VGVNPDVVLVGLRALARSLVQDGVDPSFEGGLLWA
jgi:hypothetical protein